MIQSIVDLPLVASYGLLGLRRRSPPRAGPAGLAAPPATLEGRLLPVAVGTEEGRLFVSFRFAVNSAPGCVE